MKLFCILHNEFLFCLVRHGAKFHPNNCLDMTTSSDFFFLLKIWQLLHFFSYQISFVLFFTLDFYFYLNFLFFGVVKLRNFAPTHCLNMTTSNLFSLQMW
jgi:hypothetical protein